MFGCFPLHAQQKVKDAIEFDHLYVVIPDAAYNKILTDTFVLRRFANIDKGRPRFESIDTAKKEAYFRFEDAYFELLSTANKWEEPVDKVGLGWASNQEGQGASIHRLLRKLYGKQAKYVQEKDSLGQWSWSTLFIDAENKETSSPINYWIYDYAPAFIQQIYGRQPGEMDVTGKKYRLKYYAADKLSKRLKRISLYLRPEKAVELKKWLYGIGYAINENAAGFLAEKEGLVFDVVQHNLLNKLRFIQFEHNYTAQPQKRYYSENCWLDIQENESTWWF